MKHLILTLCILIVLSVPTYGQSSFLGPTGNIVTPGDITVPANAWEVGYHRFGKFLGGVDQNIVSLNYGLLPNLEVGASAVYNDESHVTINAKYRIIEETDVSPGVAVGVFDLTTGSNIFGDTPSVYVVASKRVTPAVPEILEPTGRLRVNLGIGTGIFDGIFAGIDYVVQPGTLLMLEFVDNDFAAAGGAGSSINGGIRFTPVENVRLDAALIDFSGFAFGGSLRVAF